MPLRDRRDPKPRLDGPRAAPTTKYTRTPSIESDRDRPVPRLHSSAQRSSVYVAVVIAGALVGEKVRPPPRSPIGPSPCGRAAVVSRGTAWRERSTRRVPRRRESAFRFAHPAPPETQVVNNGFDAMWESRNKGKLFKDMTIPEPEE